MFTENIRKVLHIMHNIYGNFSNSGSFFVVVRVVRKFYTIQAQKYFLTQANNFIYSNVYFFLTTGYKSTNLTTLRCIIAMTHFSTKLRSFRASISTLIKEVLTSLAVGKGG